MRLTITKREGSDVTFLVPWKNKTIEVRWEAPVGCLNGGYRFDMDDDDESEEFEEFLWDRINISTTVTLQGE